MKAATNRSLFGARARCHVEEHFSWRNTFETLLACYAAELKTLPPELASDTPLLVPRGA